MRNRIFQVPILLAALLLLFAGTTANAQFLMPWRLLNIPGVVSVEKMPTTVPHVTGKYLIHFKQPIDHENPAAGTFLQRVFLSHAGFSRPVVMVTEGYGADAAERDSHLDEIAALFQTNQLVVEHRYFGSSVPEGAGWDPLTAANAAADHHRIVQAFKRMYKAKWISTGISKGGTAAIIHKAFYPDDVDITVAYVAPLNYGLVDGRHEIHIISAPDPEYRTAVNRFQTTTLGRRDSLMPMLRNYVEKNNLVFRIPLEEVFDYLVMEYSFAFYQWGWEYTSIPTEIASNAELFMHLVRVSPPEYFAISDSYLPFFVQAARELGYYGYDPRGLWDDMTIETTEGYFHRIFLPDTIDYPFDISLTYRIQTFLDSTDYRMIFIYGDWDPWSASGVVFDWREKSNMLKISKPYGSHRVRIGNLPPVQRKQVMERLDKWLDVKR